MNWEEKKGFGIRKELRTCKMDWEFEKDSKLRNLKFRKMEKVLKLVGSGEIWGIGDVNHLKT